MTDIIYVNPETNETELITPKSAAELASLLEDIVNDYHELAVEFHTMSYNAFASTDTMVAKIKAVFHEYNVMREVLETNV